MNNNDGNNASILQNLFLDCKFERTNNPILNYSIIVVNDFWKQDIIKYDSVNYLTAWKEINKRNPKLITENTIKEFKMLQHHHQNITHAFYLQNEKITKYINKVIECGYLNLKLPEEIIIKEPACD